MNEFMTVAIAEAKKGMSHGEVPVGAVIVKDGAIIAKGSNRQIRDSDPAAHAEIVTLREAGKTQKNYRLDDCDMYVTVNPCAMCREALKRARVRSVYYAAPGATEATHLPEYIEAVSFSESAGKLIKEFFSGKR